MPFHLWKHFPVWRRIGVSLWKKLSSGSGKLQRARSNFNVNLKGFYKMLLVHFRITGFQQLIFLCFVPSNFCEAKTLQWLMTFNHRKPYQFVGALEPTWPTYLSVSAQEPQTFWRTWDLLGLDCGCSGISLVTGETSSKWFRLHLHRDLSFFHGFRRSSSAATVLKYIPHLVGCSSVSVSTDYQFPILSLVSLGAWIKCNVKCSLKINGIPQKWGSSGVPQKT